MGQALLVVPAFGLVYLVAGPTRLRTRLLQLGAALVAMVVAAGWYIALVELWPAADRPYIGGSTTNSLLELALGYNGIGRLLGGSGNGGGGGPGGSGNTAFGGSAGITRLFTGEIALEVSWLLPAALVLLVAGLAVTLRAPRTDRLRAALLLWGGWTLVTGLVFSFMSGTMHPYYTVALAPGIAALVGVGRGGVLAAAGRAGGSPHAGARRGRDGGLGVRAARAARTRRSRGCGGSCSPRAWWRWPARAGRAAAAGRAGGRCRGGAGRAGGAGRVRRDDRGHRAHRLHPVGGDVGERDGRPGGGRRGAPARRPTPAAVRPPTARRPRTGAAAGGGRRRHGRRHEQPS